MNTDTEHSIIAAFDEKCVQTKNDSGVERAYMHPLINASFELMCIVSAVACHTIILQMNTRDEMLSKSAVLNVNEHYK